ncbi:MAG: M1 family aminopeptidase [Phycisphaerales bacterium]
MPRARALALLPLTALLLSSALAADDRFDPQSGRDLRNYPPNCPADLTRMVLRIDIPDMSTPRFSAVETLSLIPTSTPLSSLSLNAPFLLIESVTHQGRALSFSHDGDTLDISFDPPLTPSSETSIDITYTCTDPPDGLIWTLTPPSDLIPGGAQSPGFAPQIHTQGQPESNRYWFPTHDSPNERFASELIVTVPEGFLVSSNGHLASASTTNARTTYHWVQNLPHPAYLVSLVVGKFDVVDLAKPGDRTPLPVYVPPGLASRVHDTYARTRDMLRVFEERFDEPYPWDRYAQLVVWNFQAGGMENTSATSLYDTAVFDQRAINDRQDLDGLIAHELGHQWFGDLLTCNSWEHIWLNEGFASYTESIWFEARDGYDQGYLEDVWVTLRGIARSDRIAPDDKSPLRTGMVSNVYAHPDETFRRRSNPYPKGASILHMLRISLGDHVFFKAVADYIDQHRLSTVDTDDFRKALEHASGRSLEHFFAQWAYRPGTPQLTLSASWKESSKSLRLSVEQSQRIDTDLPAFVFSLPVHVRVGDETRVITIDVDSRRHEQTIELPSEPAWVAFDPFLSVLANPTLKVPDAWLIAQLNDGPTLPSRLDAARALREHPSPAVNNALGSILSDPSLHHRLRRVAADSLGVLAADDALFDALSSTHDDPRVHADALEALSTASPRRADAVSLFARLAADDNAPYAVRAQALRNLGSTRDASHLPLITNALSARSQSDQVRLAALQALAALDEKESLDAVIPYLDIAYYARTRAAACSVTSTLAHHDPAKAFLALEPHLKDRSERVRAAAISAMGAVKDQRAIDALRARASAETLESFRDRAKRAADRAAGILSGDDTDSLRDELGRLSRELADLKKSFEKSQAEEKH